MGRLLRHCRQVEADARTVSLAAALALLAAIPSASAMTFPLVKAPARLPIIEVRDICRVHTEGNRRITEYCDDPYVCDLAHAKCKPGPELQRQLDEKRRQAEEAQRRVLEQQRQMEAQVRELRARQRAQAALYQGASNVLAMANRAGSCSTITSRDGGPVGGGARTPCQAPRKLSDNVYPMNQRAPVQYRPRPNPAASSSTSLRNKLRFALMARNVINAIAQLQQHDPTRQNAQDALTEAAHKFGLRDVDAAKIIQDVAVNLTEPDPPQPPSGQDPTQAASPSAPRSAAETPTAEPAEPPRPVVSAKDEALCSYLMTLEEGDANRLGVPVPDYCEPYLRSIGRTPKDPNAPDPRTVKFSLEDDVAAWDMRDEYLKQYAPDFGK